MAKLNKTQIEDLNRTLYHLYRTEKFINKNSTFVCTDMLPDNTSFYNSENKGITPINKTYGSDLTGLEMAIDIIKNIIENN